MEGECFPGMFTHRECANYCLHNCDNSCSSDRTDQWCEKFCPCRCYTALKLNEFTGWIQTNLSCFRLHTALHPNQFKTNWASFVRSQWPTLFWKYKHPEFQWSKLSWESQKWQFLDIAHKTCMLVRQYSEVQFFLKDLRVFIIGPTLYHVYLQLSCWSTRADIDRYTFFTDVCTPIGKYRAGGVWLLNVISHLLFHLKSPRPLIVHYVRIL